MVEEHAIRGAALGTTDETPLVGIWVVTLRGGTEEIGNVESLLVAHRGY